MIDDPLWDAFAGAVITIELGVGRRVLEPRPTGVVGTFPLADPVHIITEWNPGGAPSTLASNIERAKDLDASLDQLQPLPTIGSAVDGSFPEPGVAVVGLSETQAIEFGRRFGQAAIYRWTPDSLTILGADHLGEHVMGWELTEREITHRF
jgi:hypothetical protein